MKNYFLRDFYQTIYYEDNFMNKYKVYHCSSSLHWDLFLLVKLTASFFQFEASNWLMHKAHKTFWRFPPGIPSWLLCYHQKNNNYKNWKLHLSQLLPNLCLSYLIKSNHFPTVSLLVVVLASHEVNNWAVLNLFTYSQNYKALLYLKLFRYLIDNSW